MSKTVIAIDPVTRLEGHLKVEVQVEDGKVADAWITGGMFRGFEAILRGRNPRDASQIVQRICGVCPVAHATASSLAIEAVCGVEVPENGRIAHPAFLPSRRTGLFPRAGYGTVHSTLPESRFAAFRRAEHAGDG